MSSMGDDGIDGVVCCHTAFWWPTPVCAAKLATDVKTAGSIMWSNENVNEFEMYQLRIISC